MSGPKLAWKLFSAQKEILSSSELDADSTLRMCCRHSNKTRPHAGRAGILPVAAAQPWPVSIAFRHAGLSNAFEGLFGQDEQKAAVWAFFTTQAAFFSRTPLSPSAGGSTG